MWQKSSIFLFRIASFHLSILKWSSINILRLQSRQRQDYKHIITDWHTCRRLTSQLILFKSVEFCVFGCQAFISDRKRFRSESGDELVTPTHWSGSANWQTGWLAGWLVRRLAVTAAMNSMSNHLRMSMIRYTQKWDEKIKNENRNSVAVL